MFQESSPIPQNNRKIVAFLSSQAISLFGSSLVQYAIMWHITLSTKSGAVLAIYSVCSFLPQILVSLFSGVWADRYNRKHLIILADASIAMSTLALALMLSWGYNGLLPIYIIAAIRSLGTGIQTPAVGALLPQIVPENKLMRVNSINGTIQSAVMLIAPAVSGAILSIGDLPNILMIDVATAAVGIGILLFIRIPVHARATEKAESDMWADLKEGIRHARSSFFIKRLTTYYLFASILLVPASLFNVLFVTRTYGDSYFFLTWNEVAFFAGAIIGGLLLAAWGGFKNRLHTLALGSIIFGVTSTIMGAAPIFLVYLIFIFTAGLAMPAFQSPIAVLLQEKTDPNMLGRILSLMQIVSISVLMLSSAILGPLADVFPLGWMIVISGALVIVLGIVMLFDTPFMKEGLPPKPEAETKAETVPPDFAQ